MQDKTSNDSHKGRLVYIATYGCQMNEYDTELVRSILGRNGFQFIEQEDDADIVLLNTCSVRENAHRKVFGHIHEIHHRRQGKPVMIGLLGCMATSLREELLENRNLKLDFVVGPDSYKRLPEIINECMRDEGRGTWDVGRGTMDVTLSEFETYSDIYPMRTGGVHPSTSPIDKLGTSLRTGLRPCAWVAVMRGCNNFCSFCVVPYARGRERSRTIPNICDEIKRLVQDGVKQVTLLGQNVNSYQSKGKGFADLLEEVSRIAGVQRIRFMSPHPKDFPKRLLDVIAADKKICRHIHLPLQAGNNRILELMNRGYSREDFLKLLDKIRKCSPEMVLTTDAIVGFPTETDHEFHETEALMREVEFDSAFIFKYSPRKGTMAARQFKDDVPAIKKTLRIVGLNKLQNDISLKKNRAHIGQTLEVLIEQQGTDRSPLDFQGRTDGNKLVIIPSGPYETGQTLSVKIQDATPHVLKGLPVST